MITWNPDVTALTLGHVDVRWYSVCWLLGLASAYFIVRGLYKAQKVQDNKFEPLFIYCFVGVLAGARLGHCLFYEPTYFLSSWQHIVEMFLPIRFLRDGGISFTGYEGLASHGGTIGLFFALVFYWRKHLKPITNNPKSFMWLLDCIAIATPLTACFIRLGNLMNSEIIGKATDVPWAFIFERIDLIPRHPSQLYEAIAYLVFFLIGLYFYKKWTIGSGRFFGLCLALIFTFRFFIEYTKVEQVAFEQSMFLNMGQLLSLPFIAIGTYYLIHKSK